MSADKISVDIEYKLAPMGGFIDDIITLTVDDPTWVGRSKNTAFLVIHIILWPLQVPEPLNRDYPLSLQKLAGGWFLSEVKTCLGWVMQTSTLQVFLPKEKEKVF